MEDHDDEAGESRFSSIDEHYGPLKKRDVEYKGSTWNVGVNWEGSEPTYEPLKLIAECDPVMCAIYAKKNGLLNLPGWKQFKNLASKQKKIIRLINQTKLQSFRAKPTYQYGIMVPKNHTEAMMMDKENNNDNWSKAEKLELEQIDQYEVFENLGTDGVIPDGYKKIRVHFVYAIKHDGCHKARLVAGGHLTDVPDYSITSSVVSLRGLRTVIFIAELNELELWTTDVGNAYLEAPTQEKVYIVGGPEFRDRQGCSMIIKKALYGLRSSGLRWWDKCSDILEGMGFHSTKAENDIWLSLIHI